MDQLPWVRSPHGEVCLQGGHITRWNRGGSNVLFMSRKSRFEPGQPIRGGVPVIFPWFGDDPEGKGRGAHGFARRLPWNLVDQRESSDSWSCALELTDDPSTFALWPHAFRLRLDATFGEKLVMKLRVENRGAEPFTFETALHTYFTVADVSRIGITGLSGASYLDKVDGMRRKREGDAPIRIAGETDRVYVDTGATCRIDDPAGARTIEVAKQGSRSTIVWNPWVEKASRMSDLAADEWPSFVCVESGNVGQDAVRIGMGDSHTLEVEVKVGPASARE